MADNSKDELNNRKEQSRVEQEINRAISAREQAYKASVRSAGDALDISRQITEDIKDQLGMVRAKTEADVGALNLARKLQVSAQQVTTELGNQGKIQRQILNDQNLLSSIRTEISNIDKKIGEQNASNAKIIADSLLEQQDLQREIEELQQEIIYLGEEDSKIQQERIKRLKGQVVGLDSIIKQNEDLLKAQGQYENGDVRRLVQLKQQEAISEKLIGQRKAELDIQRRIEDHTGVTGALVEGVGGIMQRLGMRSGIFQNAMELSAETMKDMSEETIRTQDNINRAQRAMKGLKKGTDEYKQALAGVEAAELGKQFSKTEIAIAGATELAKGFSKALLDPLTIALAIVDAFFDVNKAATETVQLTGQNAVFTQGLNTRLATTVQFLETTAELTKQTGMNAQNIFTPDVIAGAAELKNTMGLAANEAGGLAMIAQTTGGNIDATTDAIVDQTSAFNRANRSAVSQGQVLRDVATAADGIKASFAGMPGAIAKAAATARRLGMELSDLDNIANNLLDFESSIEAELEAQLLTGKSINMAKARELALNNDLAGLGKELFKNSSDLVEFGKMNRIQQEAQAKALGLTRDQLGKIAYQRALEAGMTEEQAAKAAGVNAEEMKRIAIQEKIQMLLGKLAQAFTPILEALVPIVDTFTSIVAPIAGVIGYVAQLLGKFLQLKPVAFALKAAILGIAAAKFVGFTSSIASSIKSIGTLTAKMNAFNAAKAAGASDKQILAGLYGTAAKEATQLTKTEIVLVKARNAVMSAGNKIRAIYNKLLDGSIWRAIKERAAIIGSTVAQKAKNIVDKVGNAIRAISNRLQNIAVLGYIRERAAVIASTIATNINTAAQTAWNAIKNFQIGTMAKSAAFWIAEKARMIADTVARWANVGATAAQTAARATQAGVNTTLAGTQAAVASTGAAAGGGLAAFGAGLGAFGAAAAPAIPILLTIGAALLMASPAIAAFGYAIKSAFEGIATIITAVGGVLSTMLDKITLEKAAAMVVMGAGFASLAGGLAILTASIFTSIPAIGMLGAIALMGPGLMNAGSGIKAMAEGVARLSEALATLETEKLEEVKDLISTTAIAAPAVAATGAITSLIQGITGKGEGEGNTNAKLDELIAAVKAGHIVDIYLDGEKISRQQALTVGQGV